MTILADHGAWDETVFVVTGDHGENVGDHGLMDHQYCLYDTLLHVPLILRGGPFDAGEQSSDLVQLTDLLPTLLDVAGINTPEHLQGRSVHPDARNDPRTHAYAEYLAPQPSMEALERRVGSLPEAVSEYDRRLRAVRTREHKLVRGSDGLLELYDVAADPEESTDRTNEQPETVERLATHLDEWLASFEHATASGDVDVSGETRRRLEELGYLQE